MDDDYRNDIDEDAVCVPCVKWTFSTFVEGTSGLRWLTFFGFVAWNLQIASLMGCDFYRVNYEDFEESGKNYTSVYTSVGYFKRHLNTTEMAATPGIGGCIYYEDGEQEQYQEEKHIVLAIVGVAMTGLVMTYLILARLAIAVQNDKETVCLSILCIIAGIIMCIPQDFDSRNPICGSESDGVVGCVRGISGTCGLAACVILIFVGIFLMTNAYVHHLSKGEEKEGSRKLTLRFSHSNANVDNDPETYAKMATLRDSVIAKINNEHAAGTSETLPGLAEVPQGTDDKKPTSTLPIKEVILDNSASSTLEQEKFIQNISCDDLSLEESFTGNRVDDDMSYAETTNMEPTKHDTPTMHYERSTSIGTMDSINISSQNNHAKMLQDSTLTMDPMNMSPSNITKEVCQDNSLSMSPKTSVQMDAMDSPISITEKIRQDSTISMDPLTMSVTDEVSQDKFLSMVPDTSLVGVDSMDLTDERQSSNSTSGLHSFPEADGHVSR